MKLPTYWWRYLHIFPAYWWCCPGCWVDMSIAAIERLKRARS